MIFQPIVGWWLIFPAVLPLVGYMAYRLYKDRKTPRRSMWLRRLAIAICLLLVGLRPAIPGYAAQSGASNLDVVFVVDTTSSMVAEDYDGNKPRLEGVKKDLTAIYPELPGARFSLISFDSRGYLELPYTTDTTALQATIDTLLPEITYYSQGSSISVALPLIESQLQSSNKAGRPAILVYVSDGEQTADSQPESFAKLRSLVADGLVLGYGTESGGKMKVNNGYNKSNEYIKDYSKSTYPIPDALSRLDTNNLKTIANDLNVAFVQRTNDRAEAFFSSNKVGKITSENKTIESFQYLHWLFAIPIPFLLILDIQVIRREWLSVAKLRTKGGKQNG